MMIIMCVFTVYFVCAATGGGWGQDKQNGAGQTKCVSVRLKDQVVKRLLELSISITSIVIETAFGLPMPKLSKFIS